MLSCLSLLCLHILTFILAPHVIPQPSMVATSAFIACYLNFHANHLKIPQHIYGVRYHKTSILYKPLPRLSVLSTNYFVNNFE